MWLWAQVAATGFHPSSSCSSGGERPFLLCAGARCKAVGGERSSRNITVQMLCGAEVHCRAMMWEDRGGWCTAKAFFFLIEALADMSMAGGTVCDNWIGYSWKRLASPAAPWQNFRFQGQSKHHPLHFTSSVTQLQVKKWTTFIPHLDFLSHISLLPWRSCSITLPPVRAPGWGRRREGSAQGCHTLTRPHPNQPAYWQGQLPSRTLLRGWRRVLRTTASPVLTEMTARVVQRGGMGQREHC